MALVRSAQYFFAKKHAKNITTEFHISPSPKAAALVWDVVEQVYLWKGFIGVLLENVAFHQVIYVDGSIYPTLQKKLIYQEIADGTFYQQYNNCDLRKNDLQENIFEQKEGKIQIRIISPIDLHYKKETTQSSNPFFFWRKPQSNTQPQVIPQIIFHIHGGGWVSMSSFSHQIYTRKWANYIKDTPIFSIDYRLLPKNKYPDAIQDCFQAYCWLLFNLEDYYNIRPEKIILAGDSAGGNMALSMCILARKYNVKQPDGLLLAYPALNLNPDQYTPSYLNCLYDPVVPYQFLNVCISQYMEDGCDGNIDPFLSPILYPDFILKNLPQMRIIVGQNDVLSDDTVRFYQKVVKAGHNNTKVIVYNQMRHGFLNWDVPLLVDTSRECIKEAADLIKEMLN